MTSLEMAELTGKQHKNVMKAIRRMEPAWVKVQGSKFRLLQKTYQLPNGDNTETPKRVIAVLLERTVQFVYVVQTEILQSDVVDAIFVVPRHNVMTYDNYLAVRVVDAL